MNSTQLILIIFLSIGLEPWPISSSGHALLATLLCNNTFDEALYSVVEHCSHSVILIVTLLYFARSWMKYTNVLYNDGLLFSFIMHGIIIQLITGLIYWLLRFVYRINIDVSVGFFITAILLLSTAWCRKGNNFFKPTLYHSLAIGVLQGCSLLPGISRFGILFWYARWQGISASFAFFLSFLLGFSLNCAGTVLGIYKLYSSIMFLEYMRPYIALSLIASGVMCYSGFFIVESLITHPYFYYLGWYELLIATLSIFFV